MKSRIIKRVIIGGLLAAMLITVAACGETGGKDPAAAVIPDVTNMPADQALAKLADSGLNAAVEEEYSETAVGKVIRTDPPAGVEVEPNTLVTVIVGKECPPPTDPTAAATGKPVLGAANTVVPDVIGLSLDSAQELLTAKGFTVGRIRYKGSSEQKDTVLLTDPEPDTRVPSGTAIDLVCSSGEQRTKTLTVSVIPAECTVDPEAAELTFKVYLDGVLDTGKITTVDRSRTTPVNFAFNASAGKKSVKLKVNDQDYKRFTLDFDKKTVTEG